VLTEYASKDECCEQVKKQAAAAAMEAAKGTSLEGCTGLLAQLSSLCTQDTAKEEVDSASASSNLLLRDDSLRNASGNKPLIEVLGSS
jgi:hypothetical protein